MPDFERELKRGILELVLLRLLSARPKYGYELVQELRTSAGEVLEVKEGTLYPVLYRLEEQSLISPQWQTGKRGVPRKYYELTAEGESRLAELRGIWIRFASCVTDLVADAEDDHEVGR
ncbi:MAG: PadR family transcriptional regulator [Thermoanaerobaculia bacterium]|nr:PadR family transcriptional regulator [Thermoanaerobaculia bacterium]